MSLGARVFTTILMIVVIAGLAFTGYKIYIMNGQIAKLQEQINTLKISTETEETTTTSKTKTSASSSTVNAIDDFEEAVSLLDYSSMEKLFADRVNFILEASECCGDITAVQATAEMKRIKDFGKFNWSQNQQVVKQIKTNLTDFTDYTIGVTPERAILAVHTDTKGLIDKVYINIDHNTLDLE